MTEVKGKKVVVLGAGKSGAAAAKLALSLEASGVVLSDIKPKEKLSEEALLLEGNGIKLETGGHSNETILDSDVIIMSPGIPVSGSWYEMAVRHNKDIIGEIEFACGYTDAVIIAVTGTNGKTTAATLAAEILKKGARGKKTALAGNIGIPFSDVVMKKNRYDYIVLELSSFQLETIREFRPHIAVILNITEDHLDRYSSMQEYAEAKARIFRNQKDTDYLILNAGDRFTNIMSPMSDSYKVLFSAFEVLPDGYYFNNGSFYKNVFGEEKKVFSDEGIKLKGLHNYENIMACLIIADILGVDTAVSEKIIKEFAGLPHRMEYIGSAGGKRFYNDSKATNVDAAVKAVSSFSEKTAVIIGGREKGTDFTPLYDALGENVKLVIALGENASGVEEIFSRKTKVVRVDSMDEAVEAGLEADVEVVLLAPACASFDMFKSYSHRGDVFKKNVLKAAKNEQSS
ncbi:MAG TPA: UDP-N-acetylmuramoyl-L-alanine--D-glutamate ligase [Firmicutes bacterium]|nr:UDP-N-acetylmuramoyl-L-alanine--D-glutamate ligase [Bacillota bacterium]